MEVIAGKRQNSFVYLYQGYSYNMDKRCHDIYRCSLRRGSGCRGTLVKKEELVLKTPHDHPADSKIVEMSIMKQQMLNMCHSTMLSAKEIFDTVCRNNSNGVHLSYVSMKSILNRERTKGRPAIPNNLEALAKELEKYEPVNAIYKGIVTADDGKIAFLFSNDELLKALASATEIYADGTFSVVPKGPPISQLYTVHIRYMDKGIAVVFALCEARTCSLYRAIWKKIIELTPGLKENVKFIMSDYEQAALKAMEEHFPQANIHGCWFHFNQAVLRKWKQVGLADACNDVLSMTMSLPLLPKERFKEGFSILEHTSNNGFYERTNVAQFLSYIRNMWLPIATKVSVYNCPARTNNIAESFHSIATRKLGGSHPNLWLFFDNLRKLIDDQVIDFIRLKNGHRVRSIRQRKYIHRDAKILQAQTDLISGRLPMEQFLRVFDHRYQRYQHEQVDLSKDKENCNTIPKIIDNLGKEDGTTIPQNKLRIARLVLNRLPENYKLHGKVDSRNVINEKPDASNCNSPSLVASLEEVMPSLGTEFPSRDICWVCLNTNADQAFIPCGHICCCRECISSFMNGICPICDTMVETYALVIKL